MDQKFIKSAVLVSLVASSLVFGSFKEIKKCFYYLWMPDIVSMIYKDYDKDFKYTHKFSSFSFYIEFSFKFIILTLQEGYNTFSYICKSMVSSAPREFSLKKGSKIRRRI